MPKLTDRQIAIAQAGATGDRLLADGSNLFLRVRQAGPEVSRTFVVRIKRGGKRRVHTLGAWPHVTLKAARAEAARLVLVERGDARVQTSDAIESFMETQIRPRYRRTANAEVYARRMTVALGRHAVDAVRPVDISRWITAYRKVAPVASMRAFAFAKGFFAWCVSVGYVDRSPATDLERKAFGVDEVPRERMLTVDELKALWHADDLPHRPLLRFLLLTGLRIGEAQAALVEWIGKDGWLRLPASVMKNAKPHAVFLSPLARAQIEAGAKPHLFRCVSPTAVQSAVHRWQDRRGAQAREDRWTPHDLRRTFATRLGDLGTAPHVIAKAIGHTFAPSQSLPTYLRSEWIEERKVAALALARSVEKLVGKGA